MMTAVAPVPASAVTVPTLDAPLSNLVNATTVYVAHATTTQNNEQVPQAVFTFPVNTDLSGVSAATVSWLEQPGGIPYTINSVLVDQVAHTVTVNVAFPKDKPAESFDIRVGGVVNASQPGSYSYSVRLTSTRTADMTGTRTYALVANASAVAVGAAVLSTTTPGVAAAYTLPITLGAVGRLSGTTAVGSNTISVTFPAGYTLPAGAPSTAVTLNGVAVGAVAIAGKTVTITLPGTLILPGGSVVTIAFDATFGLVNPAAGSYTLNVSTSAQTGAGASPAYAILVPPHLTLSIDTTNVDFGVIYPGTPTAPVAVHVTVDCDAGYVITRDPTGDVATMGFVVTGDASGAKPGGAVAVHTDTYQADMPWSTDPGVPMSVSVQYTVVRS